MVTDNQLVLSSKKDYLPDLPIVFILVGSEFVFLIISSSLYQEKQSLVRTNLLKKIN